MASQSLYVKSTWIEDEDQSSLNAKKKEDSFPNVLRTFGRQGKSFGFGKGGKFTPEQLDKINFMGYKVNPEDFHAASSFINLLLFFGLVVFFGLLMLAQVAPFGLDAHVFSGRNAFPLQYFHVVAIAALIIVLLFGKKFTDMLVDSMLTSAIEREKSLSLGYIPEIVNYLIMSMRLSPNLEKAVEFAAVHGRGKVAEDFKTLVYYVQIGKYESVEEGLDDLAYRWGTVSPEFKQALMILRSSVLENDRSRKEALLEKALKDVLEGSKEKMESYARALHQPTVLLYYFGILLPLMLAIILPIAGSLSGNQNSILGKSWFVALVYNLLIPAGVYVYGKMILSSRPPTYVPPRVGTDFPGLSKPGTFKFAGLQLNTFLVSVIIFFAFIFAGYYLDKTIYSSWQDFEKNSLLKSTPYLKWSFLVNTPDTRGNVIPVYFVSRFTIYGFLIGLALAISFYLWAAYHERKQIQDEIRAMEGEFKDAIYVLASRLGENKPMEQALKSAVEFQPRSIMAQKVFRKVLDNITTLGMTIETAIFDRTFGAVKLIPSKIIRSGLKVMSDSVGLGVNVAAKSIINLSIQISDAQKIDENLRKMLSDITSMLKTMATFVAPIVLAVVAVMQSVILSSIGGSSGSGAAANINSVSGTQLGGLSSFSGFLSSNASQNTVDPATFSLIMGLYVLEIVILLTFLNSQIEDSNNDLSTYLNIAGSIPIAIILFCVSSFFVGLFLK